MLPETSLKKDQVQDGSAAEDLGGATLSFQFEAVESRK